MLHTPKPTPFLLLTVAALLCVGCADSSLVSPDTDPAAKARGRTAGAVTVPFEADFFTDETGFTVDASCGAPPRFLVTQEGYGQARHLGRFSVHITFCIDATEILDDGVLTEGESIPYDSGVGTFTAANGDELQFTVSGAVLPFDHPEFEFQFADPFVFTGGTGRFQGASGDGMSDSQVDSDISRTQHDWSGALTLPRGK